MSLHQAPTHSHAPNRAWALYEELPVAVLLRRQGCLVYANSAAEQLTGYTRYQLFSLSLDILFGGGCPPLPGSAPTLRGKLRLSTATGEQRWVDLTLHATELDDQPTEVLTLTDISVHVRTQLRLQHSEENLRSITDHISAAVVILEHEQIVYVNHAMESLCGYGWADLMTMDRGCLLSTADQSRLDTQSALLARGKSPAPLEVRLITRSGEERHIEVASSNIEFDGRPALFRTLFDITERKRAEQGRDDARKVLRQILDGGPVPTFVINADHVVTHWNRACEVVTGHAAEEMIGTRQQWRGFYPDERPVMADLIVSGDLTDGMEAYYGGRYRKSTVIQGAYEAEGFFPLCGKTGRWLYFTAVALRDSGGTIIGAIETLQDVTERKQAESTLHEVMDDLEVKILERTGQLVKAKAELEADVATRQGVEQELRSRNAELTALNTRLSEAQEQLLQSEKLASIGQLAAGVAHEINNPIGYVQSNLGSLAGYVGEMFALLEAFAAAEPSLQPATPANQALQGMKLSVDLPFLKEDTLALLKETREGVNRVRRIVQDLRDFSRLDRGREWQLADLHQGLDTTLNVVANEIKYCAEVVKRYGTLPEVECLPSQLNQVFMNLLVNAAHAMEGKRGTITISSGRNGDEVWVEIGDNGKGIARENLGRIFDPFFTTKPIGKGTGLGLSISYGIVQKHHGRITVSSEPGVGTSFRITLPVRHVE